MLAIAKLWLVIKIQNSVTGYIKHSHLIKLVLPPPCFSVKGYTFY